MKETSSPVWYDMSVYAHVVSEIGRSRHDLLLKVDGGPKLVNSG